jgi:hypothetical protein
MVPAWTETCRSSFYIFNVFLITYNFYNWFHQLDNKVFWYCWWTVQPWRHKAPFVPRQWALDYALFFLNPVYFGSLNTTRCPAAGHSLYEYYSLYYSTSEILWHERRLNICCSDSDFRSLVVILADCFNIFTVLVLRVWGHTRILLN